MANIKNTLKEFFRMRSPKELFSRGVELLWGYPLYAISFLCVRNKTKWCFGTNVGFIDNAKYLFLYVNEQSDGIRPIWITQSKNDIEFIRSKGFEAYYKYSLQGLYHCLTSYVYIFTYHSKDINFFTSGHVKKVNLWHGVGIKGGTGGKKGNNISSKNSVSLITKITLPHLFERVDIFLSTSQMMDNHFADMFSLDKNTIFDCIYPRCYYMTRSKVIIRRNIDNYEPQELINTVNDIERYSKVYLYMPTWRGNLNDDFIKDAGFDFNKLNQEMNRLNAVFIFKLHPAVRVLKNETTKSFTNILFLDKKMDIYPILPFVDVLITDYSSIYYDYLLLNKGVLLYPFDKDSFLNYSNDLAFDYDEYTPGVRVYNFDELIHRLGNSETLMLDDKEYLKIMNDFWGKSEINDLRPLYNKIKSL